MVLMGAYFTDAINPAALSLGSFQASSHAIGGVSLILPALFPTIWMLAKAFDGIVDIPLASLTDNLKSKFGRRRLPILVCFIPMVLSYAFCWIPIGGTDQQVLNTIWISFWAFVFFTTYTMSLIAFYGSLSTVCVNEGQRTRVSAFKAFFDTISYCLVYALVPLLLSSLKINIDKLVLCLLPVMITMLIPVFMIKEGKKFEEKAIKEGYDIKPLEEEKKVGLFESIKVAFTNKPFIKWCLVNCCSFFGLQIFLVSMNALIDGGMGMNGGQMAILNTCAFAPVPVMLYLFNKLKKKKGIRFAFQSALICFSICIFSFLFGSKFILGDNNVTLQMIIGCVGGVVGSWSISAFFMVPYLIPAQIASIEEKVTGKNISSMLFAVQAFTSSIASAIAGGLVYESIKMLFISKDASGIVWAENITEAAAAFNVAEGSVFNLGLILVPFIVSLFCLLGFFVAFTMPKDYSGESVNKMLNLSKEDIEKLEANEEKEVEKDSLIINIPLWILSGSIFGAIWRYMLLNKHNPFGKQKVLHFIISLLVFPYNGYVMYKLEKNICKQAQEKNINLKDCSLLVLIFGVLGLNIISYIILQKQVNKLN